MTHTDILNLRTSVHSLATDIFAKLGGIEFGSGEHVSTVINTRPIRVWVENDLNIYAAVIFDGRVTRMLRTRSAGAVPAMIRDLANCDPKPLSVELAQLVSPR